MAKLTQLEKCEKLLVQISELAQEFGKEYEKLPAPEEMEKSNTDRFLVGLAFAVYAPGAGLVCDGKVGHAIPVRGMLAEVGEVREKNPFAALLGR